jgi:hypothetical protein
LIFKFLDSELVTSKSIMKNKIILFLKPGDRADRLSRNVVKKLPLIAA